MQRRSRGWISAKCTVLPLVVFDSFTFAPYLRPVLHRPRNNAEWQGEESRRECRIVVLRLGSQMSSSSAPSVRLATMFDNPKVMLVLLISACVLLVLSFILIPTGATTMCSAYAQTVAGVKQTCIRCTSGTTCQCGGAAGTRYGAPLSTLHRVTGSQ